MQRVGPSDEQLLRTAGAERDWGERGYTLFERTTIRPALTVSGIVGGYQRTGVKGAIPTGAVAKLDFRLVWDQDPNVIDRLIREHIAQLTPTGMRARLRTYMSANPALIDRNIRFSRPRHRPITGRSAHRPSFLVTTAPSRWSTSFRKHWEFRQC